MMAVSSAVPLALAEEVSPPEAPSAGVQAGERAGKPAAGEHLAPVAKAEAGLSAEWVAGE